MIWKLSRWSEKCPNDLKRILPFDISQTMETSLPSIFSFILGINSKSLARFSPWSDLLLPPKMRDLQRLSQVSKTENAYINKIWLRKLRTSATEKIWPTFFHWMYFLESACPVWCVRSSTATVSRVLLIVDVNGIWTRYWKGGYQWVWGLEYRNETGFFFYCSLCKQF